MRVEEVNTLPLRPEAGTNDINSVLLPVIDSWFAYRRTPTPVYMFRDQGDSATIQSRLYLSLCRALNKFPQLLANLEPASITLADGTSLKRVRACWGGELSKGQYVEARTNARIQALLPPSIITKNATYLWNRSNKSLHSLFPQTMPSHSGLRVQVTTFRCGGFSIVLDLEHALADAHAVGLLLRHWTATFNEMYYAADRTRPELPEIIPGQEIVPKDIIDSAALLHKANSLPTRRPDCNDAGDAPFSSSEDTKSSPGYKPNGNAHLLHLTAQDYDRISREVRLGDAQVTDKIAFMTFLWDAVNRARSRNSLNPIGLTVVKCYRSVLNLPEGMIGCPIVAVNEEVGDGDTSERASRVRALMDLYDEQAFRSIAYDASRRDSPTSSARSGRRRQRVEFTAGMDDRSSSALHFGQHSPIFCAPIFIPVDYLFIMAESYEKGEGAEAKWHRSGVDVFFCLPPQILNDMLLDSHLSCAEVIQDV
ncbi:Acyltransferase abl6 [Pseudocercospora fuligena]|uniref:Acyltransferase abl6 n=1 Tax=Pseudocercospora fuligena TaxID=685502 RepID=A0A8H6RPK3_9PEZI|nr:Acyltransferase abl6 [Pseudocercospora fuligena]